MTHAITDTGSEKFGSHICASTGGRPLPGISGHGKLEAASARLTAWAKILDAISEQRRALDLRVWRADPDDIELDADIQTWVELLKALADYLEVKNQ